MRDVFLAPSIYRSLNPQTHLSIMGACHSNPTLGRVIDETFYNDALIARSRSVLTTRFLERADLANADVMVIVDDDIVFDPGDFWKIVEGARATRGIYGGAYVTRSTTPHISSRFWPKSGNHQFAQTPQRRPVEIQYLATGFFAIHRDVVEAMAGASFRDANGGHKLRRCQVGAHEDFFPFFDTFVVEEPDGKLHYLSEDWAFCERARQLGFGVWCDLSIVLLHLGIYPYSIADLERIQTDPGFSSTGISRTEVAIEREPADELLETLVADLAAFCEEDEGDMRRMVEGGATKIAELWNAKPAEQAEAEFYRREDVGLAYMLDLANWHLAGGCPLALTADMAGKRVLDFGAGIGTFALAAARDGAATLAIEVNSTMRDFIAFRARKHGIEGIALTNLAPAGRFDVVMAWHVFEHLEEPEAALDAIVERLAPGGVLLTESDFHQDDGHPMHHLRDDWDIVLLRHGFKVVREGVYTLAPSREPAPILTG